MKTLLKISTLVGIFLIPLKSFGQVEIKVNNPGVSMNDNGNNTPDLSAVREMGHFLTKQSSLTIQLKNLMTCVTF